MIKSAINHGTEVPEGSRREVLIGYQYALYQHRKKSGRKETWFFKTKTVYQGRNTGMTIVKIPSTAEKGAETQNTTGGATAHSRKERYSRSPTPHLEEEEDDFIQETPEATLIAAQAYLLTTRPEPGDPREDMHRAAIRSLGIVESKIREKGPETKSTSCKEKQKEKFRYNFKDNEYSESLEEERRQKKKEDARNIIAQARVNKSRHAWREENYEDDCHDPDFFSRLKISSCIHGILHFKIFFQSFELHSSKNIVKCPFFPSFGNKKDFRKKVILK
jgi:hypothetical protein